MEGGVLFSVRQVVISFKVTQTRCEICHGVFFISAVCTYSKHPCYFMNNTMLFAFDHPTQNTVHIYN